MQLNIFKKKKNEKDQHRDIRDLLRENLNLLSLDMFYRDDPLLALGKEEKIIYLKKFFDLYADQITINRIKYHINKQAIKTLENAKNGIEDTAGASNINGMAFIMEDIQALSKMYVKETAPPQDPILNKFQIIPTVDGGI